MSKLLNLDCVFLKAFFFPDRRNFLAAGKTIPVSKEQSK